MADIEALKNARAPKAEIYRRAAENARLRTNTHRVIAVGLDTKVLGNVWWAMNTDALSQQQEEALLLWLNSSLSMLQFFGRRVTTEGAWMQMKQPAWESMPVLDVKSLPEEQLKLLSAIEQYAI